MSGPDPILTRLGDCPEYDRDAFADLTRWAVAAGCPDDQIAFFLLGFLVSHLVKGGASPHTLGRLASRTAELTLAEMERRK